MPRRTRAPSTLTLIAAVLVSLLSAGAVHAQPSAEGEPNLSTPQAAVEHFILSAREGEFDRAAESLNFSLLQPDDPARAAERFFFVLNQELWIDWESLPDRPDGMIDHTPLRSDLDMVGEPRSNIRVGAITVDDREIPVRVQRVHRDGTPARLLDTSAEELRGQLVWKFSPNTVDNIPAFYEAHGPSWLERRMPSWASERLLGRVAVWKWIAIGVLLIVTPLAGYGLTWLAKRAVRRLDALPLALLDRFDWPLSMTFATFIAWLTITAWLSLPSAVASVAEPAAFVVFMLSVTWFFMRVVDFTIDHLGQQAIDRFHEDGSDEQRRVLTQITVVRHAALLLVAIAAVGVVLVQLDLAHVFGVTLLSSAGVAAVIFGIAGHAVLGNLIAGLQIAITQPFKIGDVVYIEDNWGSIEKVAYTHVIVDTWDHRRLVFPIRYFTSNWFENWSIEDTYLVKPIYLSVDYTAPIDQIRAKFTELVEADDLHDDSESEPETLVTEIKDETLVVRLTCGAATSSDAWTLHCRVREQLIAWLHELDGGRYLPKRRLVLTERADLEQA